jgi:threonine dehydrogenase-like Zn-dependent dehydrogenase
MAVMRAGIYQGKLQANVMEIPKPETGPKDVLVKTVRSSICGSDVSGVGVEAGVQFGHETAGYIVEVGREVKGLQEGDRVWINPMNAMPKYKTCMLGGFSEYIRVPDAKPNHSLFLLPDTISWDEASLIEPFGVGTRGKNRPRAKVGDHVVVYGAGSIGLFCISGLVAQGIQPVVIDIVLSDYKKTLLNQIGAVICPLDADKFEFLKEHFGELPQRQSGTAIDVDIVVDCAGAPNIVADFCKLLKANSRLSIVGVNMHPQEVNLARVMSSEIAIMGSSGYGLSDIEEVIDNLANKRTFVNDIITHHFPLEQLNDALNMAADREKAIKVVVDME